MTLLGLQFELCFVAIKAIWIATTIPASMLWSLMMMSNEILQSWVLRLACKTVIGTGSMQHLLSHHYLKLAQHHMCLSWQICISSMYTRPSKQNLKWPSCFTTPMAILCIPRPVPHQWMFHYCPEHIWPRTCNESKPKPSMHSFYEDALVYLSICIFLHELQVVEMGRCPLQQVMSSQSKTYACKSNQALQLACPLSPLDCIKQQ